MAVSVLGDNWTIADAAELAGAPPDAVRTWLRARLDRVLIARGVPLTQVKSWLEFSESAGAAARA